MDPKKRVRIRQTLQNMAAAHASMIEFMEQALVLLHEELALDPVSFWRTHSPNSASRSSGRLPTLDRDAFVVRYRGKSCFLGNTLPFRFLERLLNRANTYVPHEALFSDVWDGTRSNAALRSVVRRLRSALKKSGLTEIALAIDGSVANHYALNLRGSA